jgi:hypothetical protein
MTSMYQEKPAVYTAISLRLGEHLERCEVDKKLSFE